jgi:tRNA(fMet)-specific endonuclease VapC
VPAAAQSYILDTNIVLHLIRNDPLALWMEATYRFQADGLSPIISAVSEGEIRSLALQFGWGASRLREMERLLDRLVLVPIDYRHIIPAYALNGLPLSASRDALGENDTWIAATAHATGSRLLTTDRGLPPR